MMLEADDVDARILRLWWGVSAERRRSLQAGARRAALLLLAGADGEMPIDEALGMAMAILAPVELDVLQNGPIAA